MGRRSRGACLIAAMGALLVTPAAAGAQSGPPPDSEFEKVTLNDTPGEPMDLAVLPDGRVLHTTRPGQAWLHDPSTGDEVVVLREPEYVGPSPTPVEFAVAIPAEVPSGTYELRVGLPSDPAIGRSIRRYPLAITRG